MLGEEVDPNLLRALSCWLRRGRNGSSPVAAAPAVPGVALMSTFSTSAVETLERELALERERAQTAQSILGHQESLKNEVDARLRRRYPDQLKQREKIERDGDEAACTRGRVEALEKRLDEMNSTFAQLLKEAVSSRDGGPSAALAAELSAPAARSGRHGRRRTLARGAARAVGAGCRRTDRAAAGREVIRGKRRPPPRRVLREAGALARGMEARAGNRARQFDARGGPGGARTRGPGRALGDAGPRPPRGAVQRPRRARGRALAPDRGCIRCRSCPPFRKERARKPSVRTCSASIRS